jgi:hypothetical protein
LKGVLKYSTSSIMIGVTSNAPGPTFRSGRAFSPLRHVHAVCSDDTFRRLI